ncbi:hypothetical protein FHL15_011023 [Xylaria flabelliformis]|uniref:Uncharacterized protein n=1 Tax=Xylaria flabelliformis TaxID=2512241 RepID=A0A553HJH5_9PEZI|nr:hypothetical protein FHL15_011023 [Xylaria flabelliformis]
MAPTKRPAQNEKTKKGIAWKRVRIDADTTSSLKDRPRAFLAISRKGSGPMDTSSPNLSNTSLSEFNYLTITDNEDKDVEMKDAGPLNYRRLSLIDDLSGDFMEGVESLVTGFTSRGKSMREVRAARRSAERARLVDLTDDEAGRDVGIEEVDPGPPRCSRIDGKKPREIREERRRAERARRAYATEGEDDIDGPWAKVDGGSQGSSDKTLVNEGVQNKSTVDDDAIIQREPLEVEELGSDADAEGETDVEELPASVDVGNQGTSNNISLNVNVNVGREEIVKKQVKLEDIDFTTGAAARYIEFMKQRGHEASKLFGSGSTPNEPALSDSSSSSEDEEESASKSEEPDYVEAPSVNDGSNNGNTTKNTDDNDSYLVYRRNKTIDNLLSNHLKTIARALNFMARARVSGIEIGDFEALAAVEREKWAELVDSPEHAADFVAKTLFEMPVLDVFRLSKRAAELQSDMKQLGVII